MRAAAAVRNTSGAERMRELGEEVVLDRPDGVEAEAVGELDLLERFLVAAPLAALVVRLGDLQLVEEIELHWRTGFYHRGHGEPQRPLWPSVVKMSLSTRRGRCSRR